MRWVHPTVLATGAAVGCAFGAIALMPRARGAPVTPAEPLSAPPIDVRLTGCALVEADQTCELPSDRTLTIWVGSPDASAVTFFAGPSPVPATAPVPVEGGLRYRLSVPVGARSFDARSGGAVVRAIPLADAATLPTVDRARELRRAGARAEAESLLRARLGSVNVREHALALGVLGRLALDRGAFEEAAAGLREAIDECRRARLASQATNDALALAFILTLRLERFDEALDVLDAVERDGLGSDEAAVYVEQGRAQLDLQLGKYRAALGHLRTAEVGARQLGLDRVWTLVQTSLAGAALPALGRIDEATQILASLDQSSSLDLSGCDRANTLISLGWALFLAREAPARGRDTAPSLERPIEPLRRALALFPGSCRDPFVRANALTNLALVAVQDADPAAARGYLADARAALPESSASLELWWLDLEAGIARREGRRGRALDLLATERRRAESILSPEVAWRATVGMAEVLEASGETLRALDEYAHAEALLDDGSLDVPLGEGREAFLGDRERSARGRVGLLLRSGRPADALAAARTARTRVIRAIERAIRIANMDAPEQWRWSHAVGEYRRRREVLAVSASRDWSLPADELARVTEARRVQEANLRGAIEQAVSSDARHRSIDVPPTLPDVTLLYRPIRDSWVGFVVEGGRVSAREIGPPPADTSSEALSAWLLGPFSAELRRAPRVRVLPSSALRGVDFHALLLDGEPLISRVPVEYSLDLGAAPDPPGAPVESLIVSDPSRDLTAARAEGDAIALALGAVGSVHVLSGDEATQAAVTEQLTAASIFHYGGHGVFAGRDGWESALALASGERLGVSDVLLLPSAPRLATLSSCFAAQAADEASAEGLGVANAFVLAGSRAVVAPTRAVNDAVAAEMSRSFYAHLARLDEDGVRSAFRAAQNDVRGAHPASDWAAYRLVVP